MLANGTSSTGKALCHGLCKALCNALLQCPVARPCTMPCTIPPALISLSHLLNAHEAGRQPLLAQAQVPASLVDLHMLSNGACPHCAKLMHLAAQHQVKQRRLVVGVHSVWMKHTSPCVSSCAILAPLSHRLLLTYSSTVCPMYCGHS